MKAISSYTGSTSAKLNGNLASHQSHRRYSPASDQSLIHPSPVPMRVRMQQLISQEEVKRVLYSKSPLLGKVSSSSSQGGNLDIKI